ncbi:GmrSD restriction endonuclease domain-containing protein [Lentzea sp. NPDC055074]
MTSGYDADPIFQATPRQIDNLIHRIHDGSLMIPDFQRNFTWEPKRTQELIRSVMSRYPAGTLLFWAMDSENNSFHWRPVEGAPESKAAPQELILDGQQRLTCLYRALNDKGEERFYLRLQRLFDEKTKNVLIPTEIDFEDAIFWHEKNQKDGDKYEDPAVQFEGNIFPLHKHREFDEWLDHYISHQSDKVDISSAKRTLRKVRDQFLTPLKSYGFPVVTLPATTSLDAVCNVFETLNKTGKPLGAFELLTAKLYPKNVKLRDLWATAVDTHELLKTFKIEPYNVMQAVALRSQHSAQRSTVLRITADEVNENWEDCVHGYAKVLDLLATECGVITPKWLPYSMLLVPMAAVWANVAKLKGPARQKAKERLKQYFWCTVFTSNFDQGANSQAGADYITLVKWVVGQDTTAPEAVGTLNISASVIVNATTRRKAIYSGLVALSIQSGARDFHGGDKLTPERLKSQTDSHHVFPKAFLAKQSGSQPSPELALNRVLLTPGTNKGIGKTAPSEYLAELEATITTDDIADIFESHLISDDAVDALRKDDYTGFIQKRLDRVIQQIEQVTHRTVSRDDRSR